MLVSDLHKINSGMAESTTSGTGSSDLRRIQRWVADTEQVLQSQSPVDGLDLQQASKILASFRRALQGYSSPRELLETVVPAVSVLLRVSTDLAGLSGSLVEVLQLLLGHFSSLVEDEGGVCEAELVGRGEQLGSLVARCAELAAEEVLGGVVGHVLTLVNSSLPAVGRAWLPSLHLLLLADTREEVREALRLEYGEEVERLVDWLFSCGDYSTQAQLVQILLRFSPPLLPVLSQPLFPQADSGVPAPRRGWRVVPRQRAGAEPLL